MTAQENFARLIAELGTSLAVPSLAPGEDGIVVLEIDDSMPFYLQFLPGRESMVLTAELAVLPPDTPVDLYRALLGAQLFNQGTGGGKFALEESSNTVVFTFERVLDGVPFAVFQEIVENFISMCTHWRKRIDAITQTSGRVETTHTGSGIRA